MASDDLMTQNQRLLRMRRHSFATMASSQGFIAASRRNLPKWRHALSVASWTASSASVSERSIATASLYAAGRRGSTRATKAAASPPVASCVEAAITPPVLSRTPPESPGHHDDPDARPYDDSPFRARDVHPDGLPRTRRPLRHGTKPRPGAPRRVRLDVWNRGGPGRVDRGPRDV